MYGCVVQLCVRGQLCQAVVYVWDVHVCGYHVNVCGCSEHGGVLAVFCPLSLYDLTLARCGVRLFTRGTARARVCAGAGVYSDARVWAPCSYANHRDIILLLLQHGARPTLQNSDGVSSIDLANGDVLLELQRATSALNAASNSSSQSATPTKSAKSISRCARTACLLVLNACGSAGIAQTFRCSLQPCSVCMCVVYVKCVCV